MTLWEVDHWSLSLTPIRKLTLTLLIECSDRNWQLVSLSFHALEKALTKRHWGFFPWWRALDYSFILCVLLLKLLFFKSSFLPVSSTIFLLSSPYSIWSSSANLLLIFLILITAWFFLLLYYLQIWAAQPFHNTFLDFS